VVVLAKRRQLDAASVEERRVRRHEPGRLPRRPQADAGRQQHLGANGGFPLTAAAAQTLASAEEALAARDYDTAIELLTDARPLLHDEPETELRALLDEAWGRMSLGEVEKAVAMLTRARAISEQTHFTDADRAKVVYQLGCCRLKLGMVPNAVQLLTMALELCERSGEVTDRLRVDVLRWRTRCYRRQREWDAARGDADAAVELAEHVGDSSLLADSYLQASLVAERSGQLLVARFYVERAVEHFRHAGDVLDAGKALNNLGGILFLLGYPDDAKARLKEAFAIALELENDVDAGYAVSSIAQVLVRCGEAAEGERAARHALHLLGDRTDHVNEIGSAQLVLGRALLEQGRLADAEQAFGSANDSFKQMDSVGHRATVWLAQGDLATRRGDLETAAPIYRRAAEALQDVRF
jgi:tetratricopeptide (TPR) repeat protein